jgi:PKHD-type hydroxylase
MLSSYGGMMVQTHSLHQFFLLAVVAVVATSTERVEIGGSGGGVVRWLLVPGGAGNSPFRSPSQGNNGVGSRVRPDGLVEVVAEEGCWTRLCKAQQGGDGGAGVSNVITGRSLIMLVVAVVGNSWNGWNRGFERGGNGGEHGPGTTGTKSWRRRSHHQNPRHQDRNIYWWRNRDELNGWRLHDLYCYGNFNNKRNGDILLKNTAEVIPMHSAPEKQTPNPAWAFNLDPVHSWAYWDKAFSKEECEKIIEIGNDRTAKEAKTRGEDTKVRKSEIAWLYPSDDLDWCYRRMTDIITDLNERFFQFDIFGATEGFQFTKYTAPGGKYGRHIDSAPGTLIRKLSFTVQLSEPEDYKGGDLCLYLGDKPEVMKKEQGFVALFPSYVLHEVKPVTQGTRYSLVSWITGKPFK